MKHFFTLKRVGIILIALILAAFVAFRVFYFNENRVIGRVEGAESEYIVIGDATYKVNPDLDFSAADRGSFLGNIRAGGYKWKVYTIKGDTEAKYIYSLWDWDGSFYERVEGVKP